MYASRYEERKRLETRNPEIRFQENGTRMFPWERPVGSLFLSACNTRGALRGWDFCFCVCPSVRRLSACRCKVFLGYRKLKLQEAYFGPKAPAKGSPKTLRPNLT